MEAHLAAGAEFHAVSSVHRAGLSRWAYGSSRRSRRSGSAGGGEGFFFSRVGLFFFLLLLTALLRILAGSPSVAVHVGSSPVGRPVPVLPSTH